MGYLLKNTPNRILKRLGVICLLVTSQYLPHKLFEISLSGSPRWQLKHPEINLIFNNIRFLLTETYTRTHDSWVPTEGVHLAQNSA